MSKVTWDAKVCEHAGNCVNGLPSVFRIEDGRFVSVALMFVMAGTAQAQTGTGTIAGLVKDESGAARQAIREVVATCPSGALKMED